MKTEMITKNRISAALGLDEMHNSSFRLDTLTGPVFMESIDVAIGLYNSSAEVYALLIDEPSVEKLICFKQVPFPADICHLWYSRNILVSILSSFEHGEEKLALSEAISFVSNYASYYLYDSAYIDIHRSTIFRLAQSMQGCALFGNIGGVLEFTEQIQNQIGGLIDQFIIPGPIEDECILRPEWRILINDSNSES